MSPSQNPRLHSRSLWEVWASDPSFCCSQASGSYMLSTHTQNIWPGKPVPLNYVHIDQAVTMVCWPRGPKAMNQYKWFRIETGAGNWTTYVPAPCVACQTPVGLCSKRWNGVGSVSERQSPGFTYCLALGGLCALRVTPFFNGQSLDRKVSKTPEFLSDGGIGHRLACEANSDGTFAHNRMVPPHICTEIYVPTLFLSI